MTLATQSGAGRRSPLLLLAVVVVVLAGLVRQALAPAGGAPSDALVGALVAGALGAIALASPASPARAPGRRARTAAGSALALPCTIRLGRFKA